MKATRLLQEEVAKFNSLIPQYMVDRELADFATSSVFLPDVEKISLYSTPFNISLGFKTEIKFYHIGDGIYVSGTLTKKDISDPDSMPPDGYKVFQASGILESLKYFSKFSLGIVFRIPTKSEILLALVAEKKKCGRLNVVEEFYSDDGLIKTIMYADNTAENRRKYALSMIDRTGRYLFSEAASMGTFSSYEATMRLVAVKEYCGWEMADGQ